MLITVLKKDLVFCDKEGKVIKVYPYGSEEQQRYERVMEILYEADRRALEKLIEGREHKEQVIDSQIEECDKNIFHKCTERSAKRYNMRGNKQVKEVLEDGLNKFDVLSKQKNS